MDDCKKVIDNLKILRTWCDVDSQYGRGLDACDCEKAVGWLDDALELLKAQRPRVLTVDEVRDNCPDYVYTETNTGLLECTIMDNGESDSRLCILAYGEYKGFMKLWKEYGKTWRCWSAKPTDEQRKAVKWDE